MDYKKITYTVADGIATVSMDSPKNLNALDEVMIDELVDVFQHCEANPDVRVVLLNSTGVAFSGGGDIAFMYKGVKEGGVDFGGNLRKVAQATRAMKKLSKPIIGSIKGAAAGGGFIVALACDYVIAADNAVFSAAFVNIGLIPDCGGFYLLTRAVGVNKASELAMTGRPVRVEEAKELGFVAEIVSVEELDSAAYKVARKFTSGPAASYAKMKELLYESEFKNFEEYIRKEVEAQLICVETEDFKRRVCAFVEKKSQK